MHKLRIVERTYRPPTEQEEEDGDYYDEGEVTEDYEVEVEPDEWDVEEGVTAVDLAAKAMDELGICEANASHGVPRWFDSVDADMDMYTGETSYYSAHLIGFTDEEAVALREKVK